MKQTLLALAVFFAVVAGAQEVNIIPKPTKVETQPGNFVITPATSIVLSETGLERSAQFLNDYLQKFYGFRLPVIKNGRSQKNNKGNIVLDIEQIDHPVPGAYAMIVTPNGIEIGGASSLGTFYAVQTLIQLLPMEKKKSLAVPCVDIDDRPRFAYRGMHLDVGRHFFPVEFVKKYIDFIAMYKMNTFHWHLTEDQGWRIEIKKYPKLTQVGGYRNGTLIGRYPGKGNDMTKYGGFYTQEQIKDIVKYASDRYITVIPEIELPGHASAAIAAYPQLSCFPDEATKHPKNTVWSGDSTGKQVQQVWGVFPDVFAPTEYTFNFLQDVLDEVIPLFPGKYVHIGGDECPKDNWKRSEFCQNLIKEKGLKDEHGLQSYFIGRIEKYLNSKGKQIIGWDEILEGGLAPNATVMSWRGEKGGIEAARQKHTVIMTPGAWMYFDHSQTKKEKEDSVTIGGYTTIQKVYSYEPIPDSLSAEESKYVLGAQANVWTEYMRYPSKVEYMIFPRMSALSEVLWSSKDARSWPDFEKRMLAELKRYDWWGVTYSKAFFDPANNTPELKDPAVK
ncbi:MAG: beta-N-acetylhexosaminidase [Bacteroidota bacterium]